jgi:2-polyprenyl-3-methyl-5-hydroxy-6-metoxy-1,4-benzoquinol methylase
MSERTYQYDFSVGNAAMHSIDGRGRKALTMLSVLDDALGKDGLAASRVLNLGCSTGIIDETFAPYVRSVVGVDIDEPAIAEARKRASMPNLSFEVGDAMRLQFADGAFDIVLCSQVYEHVPDPVQMFHEIERVLAPGGMCYFAATSRWCVVEQHYKLPFLSVIPVSMAHRYLRLMGRGDFYHERHMSLAGLRKLVANFDGSDYTKKLIADPERYSTGYLFGGGLKRALIAGLARYAYPLFPGYIWLLRKKS